MTDYVIAWIPAASRATADAAVAPYMDAPPAPGFSNFPTPLSPTGTGSPTAYGTCGPAKDSPLLMAALPSLKDSLGGDYHVVPWESYSAGTDCLGWWAAAGLIPVAGP